MRRVTSIGGGNRRLHSARRARKGSLLQVRVRRATATRAKMRLFAKWFWLLMFWATCIAVLTIGTQTALDKFFFANSDYNLAHVRINHPEIISAEDASHYAGLRQGTNLFRIDLRTAEEALERIPEVVKASVRRELPDTVSIALEVRSPVARVFEVGEDPADPNAPVRLVDASGFIYSPRTFLPSYAELPLIIGAKLNAESGDNLLHKEDLRQAILLLQTVRFSHESTLDIKSVDVSKGWCLTVRDANNTEILFEAEDYTSQLRRLQRLLDHCSETGRRLQTVNLIPKRNIPVRFLMADAPRLDKTRTIPGRSTFGR